LLNFFGAAIAGSGEPVDAQNFIERKGGVCGESVANEVPVATPTSRIALTTTWQVFACSARAHGRCRGEKGVDYTPVESGLGGAVHS
jgi:hypothetical protein